MLNIIAIIIGVFIGIFLATIAWSVFAVKMNNDWADKCKWINHEWEMYAEKIICQMRDDIVEHIPESKEGE